MKMTKDDLHNLGCLKLAEMGVWTDEECLNNMKWGRRHRPRTQQRYLKRLVEKLADINMKEPGLIEHLFEFRGDEKLAELRKKHYPTVADPSELDLDIPEWQEPTPQVTLKDIKQEESND